MLITTSGGMILPGKDVRIERKCVSRTATAKGVGGDNEAARRRNLSECASSKRQKTRILMYLLLFYPLLSLQETNLDLPVTTTVTVRHSWPLLLHFRCRVQA